MTRLAEGADAPTITGGRCMDCGHIYAPAQDYGCERCGAFGDRLAACALPATGVVVSVATVHVHRFPTPATPFTVLEIALDSGPVIRVLGGDGMQIGDHAVRGGDGTDGLPRFVATQAEDVA